jgi:FkbM family methyltransferase
VGGVWDGGPPCGRTAVARAASPFGLSPLTLEKTSQGVRMINNDLIFDIGMHKGEDADFYLKKGFRVVGIEANPALIRFCEERFAEARRSGELTVVGKAIAENAGTIEFYVNDDCSVWGTANRDWMERNEKVGYSSHTIEVPSISMEQLFNDHGLPYYMKIDIEGSDHLCISWLKNYKAKPNYVSVETHAWSYDETKKLLGLLTSVGYNRFKIVPQAYISKQVCPCPALEGKYVDYTFSSGASGLFGEEAPGIWLTSWQAKLRFRLLYLAVRINGPHKGLFRKLNNRFAKYVLDRLLPSATDWFDVHATILLSP